MRFSFFFFFCIVCPSNYGFWLSPFDIFKLFYVLTTRISIMFTIWTIPFFVYPYRHYIHHVYNMNNSISCLSISPLYPSCLQYELCHFLFIHIAIISIMLTLWTMPFLVYPYRHYIHHVYNMNYAISCLSISPYMHINTVKLPVLISTLILSARTNGFHLLLILADVTCQTDILI